MPPAWSPCRAWSGSPQDAAYRETVFPPASRPGSSVEAGVAQGWKDIVGDAGRSVSLEHYGASADYKRLFREFGITAEAVDAAARTPASLIPTHSQGQLQEIP